GEVVRTLDRSRLWAIQTPQVFRAGVLRQALDELAPTLRTAVMLRDIQELSYQEIADRLQLPEGTVKSRINRGRTELARQIQRLREEHDRVAAGRSDAAGGHRQTGVAR
ncbi:MAG: sigma-70 family RNA polymerase sigma factor, partial [Vicinamibacteria bacterium]